MAVPDEVVETATRLVRMTRPHSKDAPAIVKECLSWGASPRGVQAMVSAARARAALSGRSSASLSDLPAVAFPALRHRLVLNFHAEAEGFSPDRILEELLAEAGLVERRREERRPFWRRLGSNRRKSAASLADRG